MSEGLITEKIKQQSYEDSSIPVLPNEQLARVVNVNSAKKILDEAGTDFPFKIYKDNDGFGKDPKPTFSFYIKNPVDPDKSFEVEDLLEVEREIALWLKKWFGELPR